ncbi:MAG: hypothetical protein ACE5FC_05300 [Myxococcota bacterium]
MKDERACADRWRMAAAIFCALLLAGVLAPHPAAAGWWGGGLVFKLGWPPVSFSKWGETEDTGEAEKRLAASLTREAWERAAPIVRGIATADRRADLETLLGVQTYTVPDSEGGTKKVRVADGYIDAISTPHRMEFGYVDRHLVVRKWSARFDEEGRVIETEVFPEGRNEALLSESRPDEAGQQALPVSIYGLDYQLGMARGCPFLSRTGWERARGPLRAIQPGASRLDVELAVNGRYYLYGARAWFVANGFLPDASEYDADRDRESLAFGWDVAGDPQVRARVVLEKDRVREVLFANGAE